MAFHEERFQRPHLEAQWYALHTKHRHEKKVEGRLKEKLVTSYLPLTTVYRRWSDRYKKVQEPLFSCYVFVWMALRDRLPVLQTEGAVNLVSFRGIPAAIPAEQIEAIRRVLEQKTHLERVDYFAPGEHVRVVSGPLQGVEGKLLVQKNNHRLMIMVEGIHQAIAVEIDPHHVARTAASGVSHA